MRPQSLTVCQIKEDEEAIAIQNYGNLISHEQKKILQSW